MQLDSRTGLGNGARLPSIHAAWTHGSWDRDERTMNAPPVVLNGLEVFDVGVSSIREQQAVFPRRRIWEELSFGFFVGCKLDAADLV